MNRSYRDRLQETRNSRYSNCISTALFLVGVRESDTLISEFGWNDAYLALIRDRMKKIEFPKKEVLFVGRKR